MRLKNMRQSYPTPSRRNRRKKLAYNGGNYQKLSENRNPCGLKDTHFQLAAICKRIIEKGPGWWQSLRLFEFFPNVTNFLNHHSQGASQR
jgi:hypothetical protein